MSNPLDTMSLIKRLRDYIPVEGQEGLAVRDKLMRQAADALEEHLRLAEDRRNDDESRD